MADHGFVDSIFLIYGAKQRDIYKITEYTNKMKPDLL